ncbi:MAG: acetyltransferase [Clostridiales bacterium]|nr:acetyltransferase [Clostridiales bacterium]MBP5417617.1 acetyltransferase [Clostridiales bacterium]
MTKRLLLIGGGGHCASILDSVLRSGQYEKVGIVDSNDQIERMGITVVGSDDDMARLYSDGWTDAFISVGSVGNVSIRRKLYAKVREIGFSVPSIIDPTSVIASDAKIADGVFVGKSAVINSGAVIGTCAIINTGSIVEHDCIVGDFCHISPGSILLGGVHIGDNTHVGAGSVVKQGVHIGNDTMIGQAANVLSDIMSGVTAYGNPCKVVSK